MADATTCKNCLPSRLDRLRIRHSKQGAIAMSKLRNLDYELRFKHNRFRFPPTHLSVFLLTLPYRINQAAKSFFFKLIHKPGWCARRFCLHLGKAGGL